MRPFLRRFLLLTAVLLAFQPVRAATIYQAANSSYVAWEAEDTYSIKNTAPTFWAPTNDVPASGSRALFAPGANQTTAPASFASYAIRFRAAGTYSLYLRWRADKSFTDLDPNSANSYYRPNDFGDLGPEVANYTASSANNSRTPPAVNNYAMTLEGATFTVTDQQVNSGSPVVLKIGTREAGMFIDRFVLSQNSALTEAEFNALDNSETDVIIQGTGETFVAFEAERITRVLNAGPTFWTPTNDAPASGGQALFAPGANQTGSPSSFAVYSIRFRAAGTYSFYLRWRADKSFTDLDPNSANSYYRPNDFGDLGPEVANYTTSSANNSRTPPAVNNYAMTLEGATFTVTDAHVSAGEPVILKLGTREAGMFIDRLVFSQNPALTEAEFNSLPNSGSIARPSLVRAVGSASLNTVNVSFDRPLNPNSVTAGKFSINGISVTTATLDATSSRDVLLTTSAQTPGTAYVVTVNGVTDVSNNPIAPNSTIPFTAWRLASGWITRELYYDVAGITVADLQASPNYPDAPNALDFVRSVSIGSELQLANFGARFRAYFVPPQAGAYEFYLYADDDAIFSISSNESPDNLVTAIQSQTGLVAFDPAAMHTTGNLGAGQRYLFEVLYKQSTTPAVLGLGARRVGTAGPVTQIPLLGGTSVSTFINPDVGVVNFTRQPASATVPAGGRAKLSVSAVAPSGGTLFYQWQVNGANIPGATRPNYTTPVLTAADNGNQYRCVVGVNGSDVPSQQAVIAVGPAQPSPYQPYVGINFVGGGGQGTTAGAALAPNDVAGAVMQENFNNLEGVTIDGTQPLVDAKGAPVPVTIAVYDAVNATVVPAVSAIGNGTGNASADHALLQGYIANDTNTPMSLLIANVPQGNYAVLVYSVGFNFNSTYEQDYTLVGATSPTPITGRAQHAREFLDNPVLARMTSTNPGARDRGNYVMFDNVRPAADGTFLITVTAQSTTVGNAAYYPAVNAVQLVKIVDVPSAPPTLTATKQNANLVISWGADATGFVLESTPAIGTTTIWSVVAGTPNPIAGAGSTSVDASTGTRFYRLRK